MENVADLPPIGGHELVVYVQKGEQFEPSPRLAAALDELSKAIADEEVGEVAGFSYQPAVIMGQMEMPGADPFKINIGCVRIGCTQNCPCKGGGTYTASPAPSAPIT